jgi:hypothetical protein
MEELGLIIYTTPVFDLEIYKIFDPSELQRAKDGIFEAKDNVDWYLVTGDNLNFQKG